MGKGAYSYSSRMDRATVSGMMTNSLTENFKSKEVIHEMKTVGLDFRESRDSEEHPASVAIRACSFAQDPLIAKKAKSSSEKSHLSTFSTIKVPHLVSTNG